jgi:hypothetical protein
VSKRRKRRQGPHRGGDGSAETLRESGRDARDRSGGDRSGEGGQPRDPASLGSPGEARPAGRGGRPAARPAASDWSLGLQLAFLVAVFAIVVLIAELAGAANLGVALGVGQIAFAIAVIYLLVRR